MTRYQNVQKLFLQETDITFGRKMFVFKSVYSYIMSINRYYVRSPNIVSPNIVLPNIILPKMQKHRFV
jgi:hypothetical protein